MTETNEYAVNGGKTPYRDIAKLYRSYVELLKRKQVLTSKKNDIFAEVDSVEGEALRVKTYLMQLLESSEEDTYSISNVSLRLGESAPSVVIYNQKEVPDELTMVNRYIDTDEVKRRLLNGDKIPGARLKTQPTLEIVADNKMINKLGNGYE